jgi:hypothetical protein
MISWLLPIIAAFFGLIFGFFGLRLLGHFQWFVAWARGMAAFSLLAAAVATGFFSYDLLAYKESRYEQPIGHISFEQMGSRSFEALLVDGAGNESRYSLSGDQWQIDVRMLQWADGIPARPLYRMDQLSGRYLSLEEQQNATKSVYDVGAGAGVIDAWESIRSYRILFPFINALHTSASYLPMVDGAIYSISLGQHGLIARPLNEAATVALGR